MIHQIKRMISIDGVAEYFQLQILSSTKESLKPLLVPKIEGPLKRYFQLFEEPRGASFYSKNLSSHSVLGRVKSSECSTLQIPIFS